MVLGVAVIQSGFLVIVFGRVMPSAIQVWVYDNNVTCARPSASSNKLLLFVGKRLKL